MGQGSETDAGLLTGAPVAYELATLLKDSEPEATILRPGLFSAAGIPEEGWRYTRRLGTPSVFVGLASPRSC